MKNMKNTTPKDKKILKHKQLSYFFIGLIGAMVFIFLFNVIFYTNNLVAPFIPEFTILSLAFLIGFIFMDIALIAIILKEINFVPQI